MRLWANGGKGTQCLQHRVSAAQVTIRIDPVTRARLEREAAADRQPVSSLARLLIVDALRDRERQTERAVSA
jgi:hypothetical protein